ANGLARPQPSEHFLPAELQEVEVKGDQLGPLLLEYRERSLTDGRFDAAKAELGAQDRQQLGDHGIVFDDQYKGGGGFWHRVPRFAESNGSPVARLIATPLPATAQRRPESARGARYVARIRSKIRNSYGAGTRASV